MPDVTDHPEQIVGIDTKGRYMPYIPDTSIDTKITDAVYGQPDDLSSRQHELAARAYALL